MVPPRLRRQGSHDSDSEHDRRRASSTVQYEEADEDDEDDEDEQLFIETIRRGALAVQQRRRRLLEGPPRWRPAEQEPGMQRDEEDPANTQGNGSLNIAVEATLSRPLRSLHATTLLAADRSSTLQTTLERDTVDSHATSPLRRHMMLLYCDSTPLPLAPVPASRPAVDSNASVGTPNALRRPPISSSSIASTTALSNGSSSEFERGGGCGRLISARGFPSKLHPEEFESDTPPSDQLVDWLEIVPPKDDEINWPHLCDCVQATLGCRNCGNAVGISTLFRCGPCRRSLGSSFSWTFWTSQAIIRYPGVPLQGIWEPRKAATTSDAAVTSNLIAGTQAQPVGCLPTKEQDRVCGLAGDAGEWRIRCEALFNVTPISMLQRDTKQGRPLNTLRVLGSDSFAIPRDSQGMQGVDRRNGSLRDVVERARSLRRDLRAYIAQTATDQAESTREGTAAAGSSRSSEEGRRRRRSLLGGGGERAGEPSDLAGSDEREFRRRRTAEILESGGVVGNTDGDGLSRSIVAIPIEGPVGR